LVGAGQATQQPCVRCKLNAEKRADSVEYCRRPFGAHGVNIRLARKRAMAELKRAREGAQRMAVKDNRIMHYCAIFTRVQQLQRQQPRQQQQPDSPRHQLRDLYLKLRVLTAQAGAHRCLSNSAMEISPLHPSAEKHVAVDPMFPWDQNRAVANGCNGAYGPPVRDRATVTLPASVNAVVGNTAGHAMELLTSGKHATLAPTVTQPHTFSATMKKLIVPNMRWPGDASIIIINYGWMKSVRHHAKHVLVKRKLSACGVSVKQLPAVADRVRKREALVY